MKTKTVKNRQEKPKYIVFNHTDGITASFEPFSSIAKAQKFIKEFRERFKAQGYYKTSNWEKISPNEIDLEIELI